MVLISRSILGCGASIWSTDCGLSIMIGLFQWRAAIGIWNSCRIRPVNHRSLSTARSPCSLSRVRAPVFSFISAFIFTVLEVQNDPLFQLSWRFFTDTICRLVTLMFYLLFLLLLSGDIELNPGPITVEQGKW